MRRALSASPEVGAAVLRLNEAALEEPLLLSNLDTQWTGSYLRADDRRPRALPIFEGDRSKLDRWETEFTQTTLLGTEAKLAFRSERLANASVFRSLDPTVDSRLALELRQRLLRHAWGRPDRLRRDRARLALAAAQTALVRVRADAAAGAARAHLELRCAERLRAIRAAGVEDARKLLAKYGERRRYGLAEDSDLLQAQASLQSQETELLIARSQVEMARVELAAAIFSTSPSSGLSAGEADALPEDSLLPSDEDAGLERRPEVVLARRHAEALEWDARLARLDTLPDLVFDASYAFAGLATGYARAWSDMAGWRHAVASAGLSVQIPLGFRRERLTRRQAELRRDAARAEVEAAETRARREWRQARESLSLSRLRESAARRLADLELRKYAAAQEDFKRGRATTDLLTRFQQDIRRAEAELLRAQTDEALARVELARAAGTMTERP